MHRTEVNTNPRIKKKHAIIWTNAQELSLRTHPLKILLKAVHWWQEAKETRLDQAIIISPFLYSVSCARRRMQFLTVCEDSRAVFLISGSLCYPRHLIRNDYSVSSSLARNRGGGWMLGYFTRRALETFCCCAVNDLSVQIGTTSRLFEFFLRAGDEKHSPFKEREKKLCGVEKDGKRRKTLVRSLLIVLWGQWLSLPSFLELYVFPPSIWSWDIEHRWPMKYRNPFVYWVEFAVLESSLLPRSSLTCKIPIRRIQKPIEYIVCCLVAKNKLFIRNGNNELQSLGKQAKVS